MKPIKTHTLDQLDRILYFVAQYKNKTISDIKSKNKQHNVAHCRRLFLAIVRHLGIKVSYRQLGAYLGGKAGSGISESYKIIDGDLELSAINEKFKTDLIKDFEFFKTVNFGIVEGYIEKALRLLQKGAVLKNKTYVIIKDIEELEQLAKDLVNVIKD